MKTQYTCNKFCKEVLGLRSEGTATKWRAKGYIIVGDDGFVDIDKTISVLLLAGAGKVEYAKNAVEYLKNNNIKTESQLPFATPPEFKITPYIQYQREAGEPEYGNDEKPVNPRNLVNSMIDKNEVETKIKKVILNEKIGNLIDRKTVIEIYENILIGLKKDLLNMAKSKIGLIIRERDNILVAEKILTDAIHDILSRNAKSNEKY